MAEVTVCSTLLPPGPFRTHLSLRFRALCAAFHPAFSGGCSLGLHHVATLDSGQPVQEEPESSIYGLRRTPSHWATHRFSGTFIYVLSHQDLKTLVRWYVQLFLFRSERLASISPSRTARAEVNSRLAKMLSGVAASSLACFPTPDRLRPLESELACPRYPCHICSVPYSHRGTLPRRHPSTILERASQ